MTSAVTTTRPHSQDAGATSLDHALAMVPILREEATAIEDLRRLTPRVLAELVERDMLQILLAPARGEGDLTVTSVLQILETLASADGSTAWDVMAAMGSAFVSSFLPQDTVDRIFATPADTAATAVGRIGVATATEGGYIVEANWPFLSGTPHASWIGGLCAVHDTDEPRVNPDGQPYLVMPMLRKERVQLVDNWFTTGLRGTGSYQAEVRGAFVPASDVIDFARGQRPGLPLLYSLDENAIAPWPRQASQWGSPAVRSKRSSRPFTNGHINRGSRLRRLRCRSSHWHAAKHWSNRRQRTSMERQR